MRWRILLVLAIVFVMAAQQTKTDKTKPKKEDPAKAKTDAAATAKTDRAKLQGTWHFTKLVNDGIEVAEEGITKMTITIKDDKLTRKDGPDEDEFTFALDAAKKPKTIDLTPTEDDRKDKKYLGIYDFDGEKLKLCLADPGKRRPTKLESGPGSDDEFIVLERKK